MKKETTLDIAYLWGKVRNEELSYQDIVDIDIEYTRLIGKPSDEMLAEDCLTEIEEYLSDLK